MPSGRTSPFYSVTIRHWFYLMAECNNKRLHYEKNSSSCLSKSGAILSAPLSQRLASFARHIVSGICPSSLYG